MTCLSNVVIDILAEVILCRSTVEFDESMIKTIFDMQVRKPDESINGETYPAELGDNMQTLKQKKWLPLNLQLSLRQDFSFCRDEMKDREQESMKDIETTLSLSLSSSSPRRQQDQSSTPTSRVRLLSSFPHSGSLKPT